MTDQPGPAEILLQVAKLIEPTAFGDYPDDQKSNLPGEPTWGNVRFATIEKAKAIYTLIIKPAPAPAPGLSAEEIADSKAVLSVYAAPEWSELSHDGQEWVRAIVAETLRRARPTSSAELTVEEIARVIYQIPADEKVSRPCRLVAERVHALFTEHVRTVLEAERGKAEERDRLYAALSFNLSAPIDLVEAEARDRLTAMVEARLKQRDSEGDAMLWQCFMAERDHPCRAGGSGLLERVWRQLVEARAQNRTLAEKLDKAVKGLRPFARLGDLLEAYERQKGKPVSLKGLGPACLAARSTLAAIEGEN